ncbi:hypothetical protein QBC37DRAFT_389199 [Rhypophila decipiens]|uniref:Uncharacterized protein n=1 Tax=Rhypophila decipiens TaxID=261697 RepID=A0AAN6Y3K3_9PEZI|nr:hypothetical protein QBC37DRAFT_389199 [Rhypophila decipiens]
MPPPISQSSESTYQLFTTDEIVDQPAGFLHEIVRALCTDDAVRTRASIILSKLLAKGDETLQLDASKSLLPPRVKVCLQCKQEFKEEENAEWACQFHNGYVEIRNKYWKNHDHNRDGPIDTPENRKYDPEGFQWSCCEDELNSPGCAHRSHRAAEEVEKVKESHPLEDNTEAGPQAKKVKLSLPKPTQKDAEPVAVPEGKLVCLQCNEAYWEGFNWPRSCWFHHGSLALDSGAKVWENFDYDNEDELDTEYMREEVPEGFVYECCGESGLSKGCKWGSHISNRNPPETGRTGTTEDTTHGANGDKKAQPATDFQDPISGETSGLSSV